MCAEHQPSDDSRCERCEEEFGQQTLAVAERETVCSTCNDPDCATLPLNLTVRGALILSVPMGLVGGVILAQIAGMLHNPVWVAATTAVSFAASMGWYSPLRRALKKRSQRRHFLQEKRRALLRSGDSGLDCTLSDDADTGEEEMPWGF